MKKSNADSFRLESCTVCKASTIRTGDIICVNFPRYMH